MLGDDHLGFGCGDGPAVGVADDVGHATVHHRPEPFGQVRGDDTVRAEVVFASFDHLDVVDPGELRVEFSGVIGGADQRGA